jgi:hypothetical protein
MLVLLLGGLGIGTLLGGDDDGDDDGSAAGELDGGRTLVVTTTTVPTEPVDGDPTPIDRGPAGEYVLTYRVEGFAPEGGAVIDLERREVRAPYASRVETVADEGTEDDRPTFFLQVADFGVLQTGREDEDPAPLRVEPAVAAGSAQLALDVPAGIDAGVLEWRHEARTILDRRCEVYRTGGPVDVGALTAPDVDEQQWADLCVTADGLLLQEEWVIDGAPFRRRTAVELDESVELDDATFVPSGEVVDSAETGALAELTPDSMPPGAAFWSLPSAPDGFELRGRFGYSPPRGQADLGAIDQSKVALVLDVYEDGDGGLIVVANGGTSDNSTIVAVDPAGPTVDLGPALGVGEPVLGALQNEVRVGFDRGRFLRVWGTLPIDDLAALARTLVPTTDPDATITPA